MGAKGPYVAWLNALEAIIAVEGKLPVNIMFLAEGEEILGSPDLCGIRQAICRPPEDRLRQLRSGDVAKRRRHGHARPRSERHGRHRTDGQRRRLGSRTGADHSLLDGRSRVLAALPPRRRPCLRLVDENGEGCEVPELKRVWHHRKPLGGWEKQLLDEIARSGRRKGLARRARPRRSPPTSSTSRAASRACDPLVNSLYGPTFNIAGSAQRISRR